MFNIIAQVDADEIARELNKPESLELIEALIRHRQDVEWTESAILLMIEHFIDKHGDVRAIGLKTKIDGAF